MSAHHFSTGTQCCLSWQHLCGPGPMCGQAALVPHDLSPIMCGQVAQDPTGFLLCEYSDALRWLDRIKAFPHLSPYIGYLCNIFPFLNLKVTGINEGFPTLIIYVDLAPLWLLSHRWRTCNRWILSDIGCIYKIARASLSGGQVPREDIRSRQGKD